MKIFRNQAGTLRQKRTKRALSVIITAMSGFLLLIGCIGTIGAQPTLSQPTIEGTLHLYLVTNYGEKMQEVDRYRETGEGSMIAFILKTDKKIDMTQYLDKEGVEALKDYAGTTLQSEFMIVPDWEVFESFSYKDFAAKYANKRIRVTGTLFFPMGGWQNVTPVRMDFSKVELLDSDLGNVNERAEESSDPTKYFFVFEDDSPERKAYAKELVNFVERLQHDETTFDADLSAKLDKLRISLLTSPDGKVKIYSWEDGDLGSTISFHTLYQTKQNEEFRAVFMEDYYREPRKLYQMESSDGAVFLVEYFFREDGWSYDIGVDAFTMDKTGTLQPADIFECIPELHDKAAGFSDNLSAYCSPEPPSLYLEGGWEDNFFFELTGKDFYMPQFANLRGSVGGKFMTDFYHRFTWDGNKFRYRQLEFNPALAKYLPEPGRLLAEFETGDSIVRVDSVANGSYRLLLWKKDRMFSSAPDHILTQGRFDATKNEYRFNKGNEEYVFDVVSQELRGLFAEPETKKTMVISKNEQTFSTDTNRVITTVTGTLQFYLFSMEWDMVPIKKYRRTREFEEIGTFIELDHKTDVKPYFTEVERKYWDECGESAIYVSRARVFCSKDIDLSPYRTRRVRLTGWFESREFGWRNAGPAVFIIQQVEELENGE